MIDIRILRKNPELVKDNCRKRSIEVDIDDLHQKDQQYLSLLQEIESMRGERNRLSKQAGEDTEVRRKVKELKKSIGEKEKKAEQLKNEVTETLAWVPNFPAPDVPPGEDDDENVEVRAWTGERQPFDFTPREHDELGQLTGIIDTARGSKVAQAGFYYWVGKGAALANALFFWGQQQLTKHGFTQCITPCLAKERTLYGSGYLPFFAEETYKLENEDLSLIGTSEQTLIGFHADETLSSESLPVCYSAFSPCFRTEAGSHGKATRGIFRVHQFHKVEQIVLCHPEQSEEYHQFCQKNEEEIMQQLRIPYRVVNVCVGDLGAPGYKKYDIEAWFPGHGGYREVTSNTNLTDFQARRLNIRYQETDKRRDFVHTISATGVTDRLACAIMENNQRSDGTVDVPEVLQPYTGFAQIEPTAG